MSAVNVWPNSLWIISYWSSYPVEVSLFLKQQAGHSLTFDIADNLFDYMCWWCYFLNITISFPFDHLVPLILLSALDVGEASASALPPTLSLHYSFAYHTVVFLPPALHHGSLSFVSLYRTCFRICPECLHLRGYMHLHQVCGHLPIFLPNLS